MMQKSKLFYTYTYKDLEKKTKNFLNKQSNFLSPSTINSPRAVGDAIENILVDNFGTILGGISKEYSSQFARRAMADLAFTDKDDFYYVVDVKTHRLDTKFNMPNLTSVQRLSRFYEDDKNYFIVLKVDYKVKGLKVIIDKVSFVPIEFVSWDCLTLGALGWGQIQIANANTVTLKPKNKRKNWMIEMCDTLLDFYPKEILKINKRIDHFKKVKKQWQGR
ncbi:MAG: hypothetical protein ACR2NQ_02435 [Thermodesulfobacteriota bacterium]